MSGIEQIIDLSAFKKEPHTQEEIINSITQNVGKLNGRIEAALSEDKHADVSYESGMRDGLQVVYKYINAPLRSKVIVLTGPKDLKNTMIDAVDTLRDYGHIAILPTDDFFTDDEETQSRSIINQRGCINSCDCLLVVSDDAHDLTEEAARDIRYAQAQDIPIVEWTAPIKE